MGTFLAFATPTVATAAQEWFPDRNAREHILASSALYVLFEETGMGHPWSYLLPTIVFPAIIEIGQHPNGVDRPGDVIQDVVDWQISWSYETQHDLPWWIMPVALSVWYSVFLVTRECEPWRSQCQ